MKGILIRLNRVFPQLTSMTPRDDYAFVGDPPMIRPEADEVHISVTFTWDIETAKRLFNSWRQYYPIVKIGGPAFNSSTNGFTPGMYVRQGVTFTSRGCNNRCPWCLVPEREGDLLEYSDFAEGNIIQDNNLLQCSNAHIRRVFQMLRRQSHIQFTGGLDSSLITQEIADELRSLKPYQIFMAADTDASLNPLERAVKRLAMSRHKLRCYVMLGFEGEALDHGIERLEKVWGIGCVPFAQLYQPPDKYIEYPLEWRRAQRTWSRPAAMAAMHKNSKGLMK